MSDYISGANVFFEKLKNPENMEEFNQESLVEFNNERKTLSFNKGDNLIEEGHSPSGVFLIEKGTAKLYQIGFMGKEQIIRFVKEGDLLGYRSLISGEAFNASVTALENMEVSFIPERFFLKMLRNNPELSFDLLKVMANQLGEATNTITLLAQKTVRERLAEILLLLEDKLGLDNEGYINISLTREEMANLIGTATESAIRLISEFKGDGLITVEGRRIKIENQDKLRKLAHVNV